MGCAVVVGGQVGCADVAEGVVRAGGKCSSERGGFGGSPPLMSNMDRGERGGGRGQVGCALVVRGVVVGGRWDVLISMWWEGQGGWGQVGSVLAKRGVWGVPPIVIDKIK